MKMRLPLTAGEFFTIIDRCVYTDANAIVSAAYLDAAELLEKPAYRERALIALEFLWQHCRSENGGMFHYSDGAPHVPGLLEDQAQMGMALVRAYVADGDGDLPRSRAADGGFYYDGLKNPAGGFYDFARRIRSLQISFNFDLDKTARPHYSFSAWRGVERCAGIEMRRSGR